MIVVVQSEAEDGIVEVLRMAALEWVRSNAEAHTISRDGKLEPLTTLGNDFLRLAELAYFEAVKASKWVPDFVERPAFDGPRRSVDEVCVATPRDGIFCVYFHVDAKDRIIYVGKTKHAEKRQKGHRSRAGWWNEIDRIVFTTYATEREMNIHEVYWIEYYRPVNNITGNPDRRAR